MDTIFTWYNGNCKVFTKKLDLAIAAIDNGITVEIMIYKKKIC